MCLIINKPDGVKLDFEKFKTAVENNPDGFGISVVEGGGKLYTIRDPNKQDVDNLYKLIHEDFESKQMLIHLRYTTVGKTNLRNAHPFPILEFTQDGSDVRMAHNGTLASYRGNTDESDTRRFVRSYVRPLFKRLSFGMSPQEILSDRFVEGLLDDKLGTSSVLSFIDGDGNTLNVNALGNGGFYDEDGVYFSNSYSFDPEHRVVKNYYGYGTYGYGNTTQQGSSTTRNTGNVTPINSNKSKSQHAKDTRVQRFSEKWELNDISEVCLLNDDAISTLVEDYPNDAKLLIMELLDEYSNLLTKNKG